MPAVDAIIGLLLCAGIAWIWLAEAGRHRGPELRHPKLLLLVASGMLPFLWFVLASANRGSVDWAGLAVPLGLASVGAYLLLEYLTVRYLLQPGGFGYRTLFAGSGFASWGDIRSVQWSLLDRCGPAIDPLARPALEQTAAGRPPLPW